MSRYQLDATPEVQAERQNPQFAPESIIRVLVTLKIELACT